MKDFINDIHKMKRNVKEIYIYGAGLYGKNAYEIISKEGIEINGFVTTSEEGEFCGLEVKKFEHIKDHNVGIIIGANMKNTKEIVKYLEEEGFLKEKYICAYKYIDHGNERGGINGNPAMEFTTKIGCSINCRYCPQKLLIGSYYMNDNNRNSLMTVSDFELFLSKIPQECNVVFGGMAEPFLNPDCVDMIEKACESGRRVELQTTLVGLNSAKLEKLLKLPIEAVMLHVADKENYADIPVTREYLDLLDTVIHHKKKDEKKWVTFCNAQAEPADEVKEIVSDEYNILTSLLDRAGNLEYDDKIISKKNITGKIKCSQCTEKLNKNIILPDGTVLLCSMDYGMKHVLGNLSCNSYEEIMTTGKEMNHVKSGMQGDESIDILCRNCSCAYAYK